MVPTSCIAHSPEPSTLCTVTDYKHILLQYAVTLLTSDHKVLSSDLDLYAGVVYISPSWKGPGWCIKLGYRRLLLYSLQLIIQWSSCHSLTLNSLLSILNTAEKSYGIPWGTTPRWICNCCFRTSVFIWTWSVVNKSVSSETATGHVNWQWEGCTEIMEVTPKCSASFSN
jgi:hypothetical protein